MRTGALLGLLLSAPRRRVREGLCGSCVQPSVKAVHAAPAQAPIRWRARKGPVVAASIRRDPEGQGQTNHLVGQETRREFKSRRGSGRGELAIEGDHS